MISKTVKLTTNLALGGALIAGIASPAVAAERHAPTEPPEAEGEIGDYDDFVTSYPSEDFINAYDPEEFINDLGSGESEDENVIVLEADILFSSNEWELPSGAGAEIDELAEEVPDGASVQVHGHTDSLPVDESQYDFDNQELSENRAEAVAEALEDERSDLSLELEGFGDSEPAVEEDEEDPSTFAANRRVEIRYD